MLNKKGGKETGMEADAKAGVDKGSGDPTFILVVHFLLSVSELAY